jgi:hypothetical protein
MGSKNKPLWIHLHEEHDTQFSSKQRALNYARMETLRTHRKHHPLLSICWRMNGESPEERLCWTVVLQRGWVKGKLVTL